MNRIRVLVVEDSAFMRRIISDIVNEHSEMEVIATARDGVDALGKIKKDCPDVVTMDLEMPRLDGIKTLQRLMAEDPLPVIMLSTHTRVGSEVTLKALDAGAVDIIAKPSLNISGSGEGSVEELKNVLPQKIKAAASAQVSLITTEKPGPAMAAKNLQPKRREEEARVIIAIGASTGGPKALEGVFNRLPANLPATILLSQHMPPGFTLSFAQRLDMISPLRVKEAENGDPLLKGLALVAPGGFHMIVKNGKVQLDTGPRVNFVRPAIDVMYESLLECEQKVLVVIMTGMGKDGTAGTVALKKKKKDTIVIVQEPESALIPSMPAAIIKAGLCDARVPLEKLASEIDRYTGVLI